MKSALVYIRVSTDEQAEKGNSLKHQEERIRAYCQQNGITIDRIFKEDYSAKSFDRPSFNDVVDYASKNRANLDRLLVLKWDRFSRNAPESYQMLQTFQKLEIEVQAVEQPLDLKVPENKIMLAIYLAAPEVENDRRSLNVIAGMRQMLKRGEWTGVLPIGYWRDKNDGIVKLKDYAPLIRQGFQLASEGLAITQIVEIVNLLGFNRPVKAWSQILRNPFYAGIIRHSLLKEEIDGKHPPIVSKELFYEVQNMLNGKNKGRHRPNEMYPLKRVVLCDRCGKPLSGYLVKKKGKHYYKCPTTGCGNNVSTIHLHEKLMGLFSSLKVNDEFLPILEPELIKAFKDSTANQLKDMVALKSTLTQTESKLENLEVKFIEGKIDSETYEKYRTRFKQEIHNSTIRIANESLSISNHSELIEFCFKLIQNIGDMWQKSRNIERRKLLELLFPGGLIYSKGSDTLRTERVNEILNTISSISMSCEEQKNKTTTEIGTCSALVAPVGIEPTSSESESEILSIEIRSQKRTDKDRN
jgi:site-specific DNA recombinase